MSGLSGSAVPPGDGSDELALLSGYLDDELDDEERAFVRARLSESAIWREELAAVDSARAAVRALPEREPPAHFWPTVTAAVRAAGDDSSLTADTDFDERAAEPIPLAARRTGSRRVAAWVAAAAGVAAAVVAVFVIPGRTQVRPDVTAVATQHAASSSDVGDAISGLVAVAPLQGLR